MFTTEDKYRHRYAMCYTDGWYPKLKIRVGIFKQSPTAKTLKSCQTGKIDC